MRRLSAWSAAAGLLIACVLTGCQPGNGADSSGSAGTAASGNAAGEKKEPVKIEFWYGNGGVIGDTTKSLVDRFNQSQDEVVVNAIFQESNDNIGKKLLAAIVGNVVPDVVQVNARSWPTLAYDQALYPLDDYIGQQPDFDYDDFVKGMVDHTTIDGKTYTLPYNRSLPILYYNKDIVKQIGLDPENPVPTWDKLAEAAQKATVASNGRTERFGYASVAAPLYYYSLIWSNGGDILAPDNTTVILDQPQAAEGLEMYRKMIYDSKTMMQPSGGGDQEIMNFQNEKVAFLLGSTGNLTSIRQNAKFDLGAASVPKFQADAVPSASGGNLAIVAKAPREKRNAAWKFIQFMTAKEQTIFFSQQTGYMPIRQSAIEADEMKTFYDQNPLFKVAVNELTYGRGFPMVNNFEKIEASIQTALEKTYSQNVPAQTTMKEAADQIRAILK